MLRASAFGIIALINARISLYRVEYKDTIRGTTGKDKMD